ncbi:phospholipase D-like domain-containing protein [Phycicoccus avicenniae]|uniref:phospholipase D-like domain-containing protein n=1 Tax=Phycicoccus avicenniae TaxID=2828860 RepID=UPI003D2DC28B
MNWASAGELAQLPIIGAVLSERIVRERRTGGPYADADDLAARVDGLGSRDAARLLGVLAFDTTNPCPVPRSAGATEALLAVRDRAVATTGGDAILGALEALATWCAGHPSPAHSSRSHTRVTPRQALDALQWKPSDVSVLSDGQYPLSLTNLLDSASQAIDVCMFHIAAGQRTQTLMDALTSAVNRGVEVRVLLDRDRPKDPYNSNVVNIRARRLLQAGGVRVRQDPAHRLLHSKFVIVDLDRVVLGSHNWSSGSFAGFDDVSVILQSAEITSQLVSRFDDGWEAAE